MVQSPAKAKDVPFKFEATIKIGKVVIFVCFSRLENLLKQTKTSKYYDFTYFNGCL